MVKNNKFWKSFGRLSCWIALLVTFLLLSPACDELKKKMNLAKDLLVSIRDEEQALAPKRKEMRDYEDKCPDPNKRKIIYPSYVKLLESYEREEKPLLDKYPVLKGIFDDMAKEVNDLSKPGMLPQIIDELVKKLRGQVPSWIADQIIKEIMERLKKLGLLTNAVHEAVENKLNTLSSIHDEEMAIIDHWEYYPPEPNELFRMDELIVQASTVSLNEEVELVAEIVKELDQIVPSLVPVVAGSVVDRCSFIIEEGHPLGLEDLDDGVLAPGSVIILQLPPTWTLTAPATIEPNNNNLTLDICGNEPGSSLIKMQVVSELEPNRPDDSITVTFNGIQIGNRTGIVSGTLTVLPGRTSTQDFVVLPQACEVPPLSDINFDGTVNFKDLAVLANEWLAGTGPPASAGSLVAWGSNGIGQCNVPTGTDYVTIAGGWYHGLALRADGSLVAWGYNYYGQCNVPTGNNFKAIAGGRQHSLALKSDGTLVAWGDNSFGQCNVPAGNNYVAIAAGSMYSLALRTDGTLVAWGANNQGQCNVPAGNNFKAIAAGSEHGVALKSDGALVAWGANYNGQCNNVPAGTGYVAIAAGLFHSLALRADGSLVAWGLNQHGQCNVPAGTGYLAIAAGEGHSLALKSDRSLVAWGYNYSGQCNVPSGTGYIAIASGAEYNLALRTGP